MASSVLIVDDDPSFRERAKRLLADAGLEVVDEAGTAEAGLSAAKAAKPDAILLDIMLPDGDGVELASQFASLPWGPRILLTSSSPDVTIGEEIETSGAVGFVPKNELPGAPLERLLGDN